MNNTEQMNKPLDLLVLSEHTTLPAEGVVSLRLANGLLVCSARE